MNVDFFEREGDRRLFLCVSGLLYESLSTILQKKV